MNQVSVIHAETGKSGASFLKIVPGARPVGMGGAYTAIASDINALYYNPAGIGGIRQSQLGATHTEWLNNVNYDFAGGVIPTHNGAIGVSAVYLTTGKIEGRDESGNQTGDFYSSDMAITFSGARRLNSNTQVGGSVKALQQKIASETADGFALDIGGTQRISKKVHAGLAVKNVGPKMKFIDEQYSLPVTITMGTAYNLVGIFNLALDVSYEPVDKKRIISFGTEFWPKEFVALRAGYLYQAVNALYDSSGDVTNNKINIHNGFGGGIGIKVLGHNLDYAIVPYSELGTTQRISLQANF